MPNPIQDKLLSELENIEVLFLGPTKEIKQIRETIDRFISMFEQCLEEVDKVYSIIGSEDPNSRFLTEGFLVGLEEKLNTIVNKLTISYNKILPMLNQFKSFFKDSYEIYTVIDDLEEIKISLIEFSNYLTNEKLEGEEQSR
jgi:hypothetical protein